MPALIKGRTATVFVSSLALAGAGMFCGLTSLTGHDQAAHTASSSTLTSAELGAPHGKVPARDAFSGRITTATGRFRHDHGRATADLAVSGSGVVTRQLTLTFHSRLCNTAKHCARLTGRLKGTITARAHRIADTGQSFIIRAGGTIRRLGHVRLRGAVHGTGFVYRGRESLQLTVTTRRGRLTLHADSRPVPGFTSP